MSNNTTAPAADQVEQEEFDKTAKAGWAWFTKFLLINVILCALALLFVGALTVWS